MSYALEIAPDAMSQLRELDVLLQELALDELDRVAANVTGPSRGPFVQDFDVQISGTRHYVFLRLGINASTRLLTVFGVAHFARPSGTKS